MIRRDDILSMEYLKKTEFTGCHQGMRYRLEGIKDRLFLEKDKWDNSASRWDVPR